MAGSSAVRTTIRSCLGWYLHCQVQTSRGNLPPDGLVQIETRTGERLFLTRSSLVSVEIVPVADPLKFLGTKRLAAPSDSFPPGASVPSPFVLANDALPDDVHAGLIAHVLSQDPAAMAS